MISLLPNRVRYRRILASVFRQKRFELGKALFCAVRNKTCASWKRPLEFDNVQEWGRSHLYTAVDLMARSLKTGAPLYQELFEGWVRSRMVADLSSELVPDDYDPQRAVEGAASQWLAMVQSDVPKGAIPILEGALGHAMASLGAKRGDYVRILCIGDCIQFETITALIGPCARDGIGIVPTVMNERIQARLRNQIRATAPDAFDLVFFNPFSHAFIPEYESLQKARSTFLSGAQIAARLEPALREVALTLETLRTQLEGRIYVHNTGATIQRFGGLTGVAKHLATWNNRRRSRHIINDAVAAWLREDQTSADGRMQLLDENSLTQDHGVWALGRVHFSSHAYHPTLLGIELGRRLYREAVFANTRLASKKVIVCDLDNTLWDGLTGEGTVRHFRDRQDVLRQLKGRGVLLSINSKNDPRNIRWTGAVLDASDFVSPQINWDAKTLNMARIRDELNLKTKDFVFIDDRPDERERMSIAFPEMVVLDATDPATWKTLHHWTRLMPSDASEDRTCLYQDRIKREQFLRNWHQEAAFVEDETAALEALDLSVVLRAACGGSDLRRAVELVNRTNQFNLCGSRTSLHELQDGICTGHSVILAEARDKYGSMGIVGVMVAQWKQDRAEVPIFVLSCRAFGFGIEYALLNSLRALAPNPCALIGHYKATQFNEPCRDLYAKSGLTWDGHVWMGDIADLRADPHWLTVQNEVASVSCAITSGTFQMEIARRTTQPTDDNACNQT
jgi:FkbH-like protein